MKRERARAEQAFELAEQGKTVCVISSGDAGIYGMTPLIYEMKRERNSDVEIVSLPGISAFQKAASLLGADVYKRQGGFFGEFYQRMKLQKQFTETLENITPENIDGLLQQLPSAGNSPLLRNLSKLSAHRDDACLLYTSRCV